MAALPLVQAGQRVLMIERGGWVARGPDMSASVEVDFREGALGTQRTVRTGSGGITPATPGFARMFGELVELIWPRPKPALDGPSRLP